MTVFLDRGMSYFLRFAVNTDTVGRLNGNRFCSSLFLCTDLVGGNEASTDLACAGNHFKVSVVTLY